MFPTIFTIGAFSLNTLVVVMCLGVFAALFVIWRRGKELHFDEKELFDVIFVSLWWMMVGARIGYGLLHLPDFGINIGHWLDIFSRPGFYYPGGMIGAAIALMVASHKRKWDVFQLLDILVVGVALLQAFVGLGTWLAGVGYGLPTTSFLGMQFVGVYDRRFPVQLLELLGYIACFLYLWWVEGVYRTFSWYRKNRSQAQTGFLAGVYLIWWGAVELITTILKTPELVFYSIRFDLVVPVVLGVAVGLWILMHRSGATWFSVLDYFGLAKKKSD